MAGLGPWSSEVKNAVTETKLASRDFDPDRRLDVDVPAREAELRHPFDPDARVNPVDDGRPTIGEAGGKSNASALVDSDIPSQEKVEEYSAAYLMDLMAHSEVPDTLKDFKIDPSELRIVTGEERKKKAEEFAGRKKDLILQWEEKHGPWPTYQHDVYNDHDELIHKAAQRYEVHHVVPLGLGGSNTVDNITPLSMEAHRRAGTGIHGIGGSLSQLWAAVKGARA